MMAHCEGMLLDKTLFISLFGILVWFCPPSCWCSNLTALDLHGMQASQISIHQHMEVKLKAALAIDGNSGTNLDDLSCSHTKGSIHPWWKVDLGTSHCLGRITLVNRGDCCNGVLYGAVVRAGIESEVFKNAACGLPVTSDQASIRGAHIPFVCDPLVVAQYVSVDNNGVDDVVYNSIALCEVMVEEYPMEDCPPTTTTVGVPTAAISMDPSFAMACMSSLLFEGKCIVNRRPLLTVHTKSLLQCFVGCKMNNACWSFDTS